MFLFKLIASVMAFVTTYGETSFIMADTVELANLLILFQSLKIQTMLCDVEDSREKLDRFFSYNFLFFEDD